MNQDVLSAAFQTLIGRDHLLECRKWTRVAETSLDQLPETEVRETLRDMCLFLVERGI